MDLFASSNASRCARVQERGANTSHQYTRSVSVPQRWMVLSARFLRYRLKCEFRHFGRPRRKTDVCLICARFDRSVMPRAKATRGATSHDTVKRGRHMVTW